MSLDFALVSADTKEVECECECCGNIHIRNKREIYIEDNITNNLAEMADKAGLYEPLWNSNGKKASEILADLEIGVCNLGEMSFDDIKKYTPSNGWGDVHSLRQFTKNIISCCKIFPDAVVMSDS
jgi:hypothetical protein